MTWTSQTDHFGEGGDGQIGLIERLPARDLGLLITSSDRVVGLRMLAEVMLNGDNDKLDALLRNRSMRNIVKHFLSNEQHDPRIDDRDHEHARRLQAYIDGEPIG